MTKLLFPLIFFFGLNVNAQQWPQPGAEWTYCYGPLFTWGFWGSDVRTYTHDSIVNGDLYNVMENLEYPGTVYLTRFSNDTVYRWVNNQEYLFFHFQMHLGEEILTYRSRGGMDNNICQDVLSLIVVDSGTVILGAETLTRWKLRDTMLYNDGYTGYCDYWIYERLGFTSGYWLWSQEDYANCDGMILEAGFSDIGNYEDQSFTYHWNTCETTGIESSESRVMELFPNPATETLKTSKQFLLYKIISADGKLVVSEKQVGNTIPVDELLPGIYFISLELENDQQVQLTFVKE